MMGGRRSNLYCGCSTLYFGCSILYGRAYERKLLGGHEQYEVTSFG